MTITYGSLFSGVGGLDLGLERAGMRCIWQSEIDPFASKVLAKHWPDVLNLGDVTTIDWSTVDRPDLICGGYPCQPFSTAGKRRGQDDPRHLWPWMLGAIRALRPRFVVAENVAAHLGLGFDRVLADFAACGFDAEWSVVPACAVGAPHVRRRLFLVAYADGWRWGGFTQLDLGATTGLEAPLGDNAHRQGVDRERSWNKGRPSSLGMADGLPGWVDRRRSCGNAVVPQVAELIGRQIVAHDHRGAP